MSNITPRCTGSPVASVGPTADFYAQKALDLAKACAIAMRSGDIQLANELYERGVNAVANYKWNSKLASIVGTEFSMMTQSI